MVDYLRARSPERKAERKQAIMAAADELFRTRPYHDITLGQIAEGVGLTRANLYRYAKTKEEIFLSLHAQHNEAYFAELEEALSSAPLANKEFAEKWAAVTARNELFLKYQEVLVPILESNVTFECLVEFKRNFARIVAPIDELLIAQCSLRSAEEAHDLYRCLIYQASGLRNLYECSKLTREAMEAAGLPPVKGSFEQAYAAFTLMCLDAWSAGRPG